MPHRITVFTGNCPLCREVVEEIEAGKCSGCQLTVYSISENIALAREHGVRVVPTIKIDGEVKIEGHPDIPFVCDDDTYAHFRKRYSITHTLSS